MKRWARRGLLAGVALVLLSVGAFFFLRAQSRKEHLAEIVKLESQALDARYPDLEAPFSPWLATETLAHNLDSLRKQSQTRAAGAQRAYATARDRRDTISTHERLADTEGPQHDEVEAHVARLEQLAADYSALAKLAKATLDKIAGKGKPDFAGARAAVDTMRDTRGLLATSPVDDALERVRRKLGDASTAALPATLELASSLSRRPSSLEDFETAWTTCRDDLTSGRFVATAAATEATETVQALCRSIAQIRDDLEAVEGEFAPDAIAPRLERHEIDAIFEAWVQRRSGLVRDIQARLKPYSERPYALTPASLLGEGRPVATRLDDVRVRLESAVRALVARLIARVERESGNTAFDPDSVEEIRQAVTSLRKATRIRFQDEEKSLEDALQRLLASHGAYVESVRAFYEDTRRLLFEVLTSGDTREFTRLLDERIAEREKRQWGPDARFEALRAAGAVLADLQARALRTLAQRLADGRVKFERVRLRDRVDARWKLLAVDRELGTIDVEVRGRGSQRRTELVRIAQVHPEQLLAWVRNPAPALRAVAALSAMEPVDDEPGLDLRPAVAAWQATHEAFGALEGEQAERLALWVAYAKTWHADLDGYQQRREEGASAAERAADAFRGALQWVAAHEELKRLYDGEGRLRYTDVFDERRSFLDKLYSEVRAMLERNKLLLFFPGAGVVPKEDGETEITLNFDAPIQKKNILHGFGVLERQPTSKQSTPKEPTAKLQLHLLKGETSLRRDRPLAFDQPFDPAKRITFEMNIHTLAGSYLLAFDIDGVKVAVSSADPRIFDRRFDENTPLLEDESRLPEFDFYAMGRGVAFHVAPTRNFGSMFPYEGWNWPRAGRGRNFKAWQDKRKLRDPGNRLFAFDRGTAYRVRVVREKDKMRLFVDDVLVAAMQRKEWADIGTRSDIDRNMRHGSGRIQLLTWTPLIVDDVVLTGTLSERWKLDQKARLEAEAKKREEAARGEGERK